MLRIWMNFLKKCFDFDKGTEQPLSEKGALLILLLTVTVLAILLTCLIATGPEQLPGT